MGGMRVVAGGRCLVAASDSAVKGGTVAPMGLKKALRAQEIALENKLPVIYLVESGGANLMYQSEIFVEGGRSFANQARMSAAGLPQISVVHGSRTAGGGHPPGLAGHLRMGLSSAQFVVGTVFANGGLHQGWAGQVNAGAPAHQNDVVRQARQIGAARRGEPFTTEV